MSSLPPDVSTTPQPGADDGQPPPAQRAMRRPSQKCRVNTAGIGDEAGAVGAEESAQPFESFGFHSYKIASNGGEVEEVQVYGLAVGGGVGAGPSR